MGISPEREIARIKRGIVGTPTTYQKARIEYFEKVMRKQSEKKNGKEPNQNLHCDICKKGPYQDLRGLNSHRYSAHRIRGSSPSAVEKRRTRKPIMPLVTRRSGGCGKPGHIGNVLDPGEGSAATQYCETCAAEASDTVVVWRDTAMKEPAKKQSTATDFPKVRVMAGWADEGKTGDLLAGPVRDTKGQDWMVVQWEGDDDPDLHKVAGLEMAVVEWKPCHGKRPFPEPPK